MVSGEKKKTQSVSSYAIQGHGHTCVPLVQRYLSIAGAGEQSGEAGGVFGHAVHPISVTIQGSQERLGQHPLELGGIESTGVLSAHLERMEARIIVPRN